MKVVFTFDDGYEDVYRLAAPALEARGMRGTMYLIRDRLGFADAYMTIEQARDLYERGHEIGSHTLTHQVLSPSMLPQDVMLRQICDSRARWLEEGIPVRSLAYPGGFDDGAASELAVACNYGNAVLAGGLNNARGYCGVPASATTSQYFDTLPPLEGYARIHRSVGLSASCSVSDLQQMVLDAEAHATATETDAPVLVLMGHHVCAPDRPCDTSLGLDVSVLGEFLDWLAARAPQGTVVRTMAQAFGSELKPAVWSGTPLVINGGMESRLAGSASPPDCWSRDVYVGATAAAWSSVQGRAGLGEQAVVTSWTRGGTVRLAQDVSRGTACNVPVHSGRTYLLSCWYRSDVPLRLSVRSMRVPSNRFDGSSVQSPTFPASPWAWAQANWSVSIASPDTVALSMGFGVFDGVCTSGCIGAPNTATFVVDDCSAAEQ